LAKTLSNKEADLPRQIRVSVGTAIILGLLEGKLDAEPTTAYLMTYTTGKCTANCAFCPQARNSHSRAELLSRITWPRFSTARVLKAIKNAADSQKIRRVCIQALNYPNVIPHLIALIKTIKQQPPIPVSISCQPLNTENIHLLAEAGADRIGIALDAATEKLFNQVKGSAANGPYIWSSQLRQLQEAVKTFGKGNVSTHLIVGLGETEQETVNIIQQCVDTGILPALFAFTPISGTAMEKRPQPSVESYRRIQLARHLIVNGITQYKDIHFEANGRISGFTTNKKALNSIVESGKPFLTSGCPDCNRPFYNEKPSGPIYNYPRRIRPEELSTIKKQLRLET
jgi:biotin synthase-related radical SAM superfamily protein